MVESTEIIWRRALEQKGRDWVLARLARPGQANDVVLDIVFEQPYPTREFCQQWCAEQGNKLSASSGHRTAVIIAAIVLVVFVIKAVVSFEETPTHMLASMLHY